MSGEIRERIDVITRQLPTSERGRILRIVARDPGGIRENAVLASVVRNLKAEIETLGAYISHEGQES